MNAPRIVWMPRPSVAGGSRAAPDGLIATLRGIACGHEVLVHGRKATDVRGHIMAARRGSHRWYESRTVSEGALVRRVE